MEKTNACLRQPKTIHDRNVMCKTKCCKENLRKRGKGVRDKFGGAFGRDWEAGSITAQARTFEVAKVHTHLRVRAYERELFHK